MTRYTYTRDDLLAILQHYEEKWGMSYEVMNSKSWAETSAEGLRDFERHTWNKVYNQLKEWDEARIRIHQLL